MIVHLADEHGPVLTGRAVATRIRDRIERWAQDGEVVVDLADIDVISPSFADEFFAKMPIELTLHGRVRFEHASDDLIRIARVVTAGRTHLDLHG